MGTLLRALLVLSVATRASSAAESDPLRALIGHRVEVALQTGEQLQGTLTDIHPDSATLTVSMGASATRVARSSIASVTDLTLIVPTDGRSPLERVADDLERRAVRRHRAGGLIIAAAVVTMTASGIGMLYTTFFTYDKIDLFLTLAATGVTGIVELFVGLPMYSTGSSEMDLVRSLRAIDQSMAFPAPPRAPRM